MENIFIANLKIVVLLHEVLLLVKDFLPKVFLNILARNLLEVPGPGTYQQHVSISPKGFYFNSKYESSRVRTFGKESRKDMT